MAGSLITGFWSSGCSRMWCTCDLHLGIRDPLGPARARLAYPSMRWLPALVRTTKCKQLPAWCGVAECDTFSHAGCPVFLYYEISHHDGWPLCARGVVQSGGLSGDVGARGGSLKMAPPPPPDPPLEPSRAPGESSAVLGALGERASESHGAEPLISALRGTAAASGGGPRAKASSSSIRPRRARSASCTSSVTCGERAPW